MQGLPPARSSVDQSRREMWFGVVACAKHDFPQRDCNACWGRMLYFLDDYQGR
jgi:hypothetical protein